MDLLDLILLAFGLVVLIALLVAAIFVTATMLAVAAVWLPFFGIAYGLNALVDRYVDDPWLGAAVALGIIVILGNGLGFLVGRVWPEL